MLFEAALNFVRTEIDKDLRGRLPVPSGYLRNHVTERSEIQPLLDDALKDRLIRHLETFYGTKQDHGHTLTAQFKEWYPERRQCPEFRPHYWPRLRKYWLDHSILPVGVIGSINQVTDEVLGYLGDPLDEQSWKRRGLVMGYVQSGKTTNYSALITKAADAGYRVIVVLAGITNSLRTQTQERLDQAFVGKSSLGDRLNSEVYPIATVLVDDNGQPSPARHPYCGTTQQKDFNVTTARSVAATEGNFADPILFVTKKNEAVLRRLAEWLRDLRQGRPLEGPMLLIDDEADSASVNTARDGDAVTRINQRVRELLQCSRRSSYVGYTATPFANIFINPDTNEKMLNEDLFPKHFIKSLDPPDNYVGAKELFMDNGRLAGICVHDIPDDYIDLLPLKHKSEWMVDELPRSLTESVLEYFLFRAIRILDEESRQHSSMMVNVSRYNRVQQQIHDLIYRLKESVSEAVAVWARSEAWDQSEHLRELHRVWQLHYKDIAPYSWESIRGSLAAAVEPVEVRLVNMRGTGLDYSNHRDNGLHVIAVGGLALARGLTLEGLAISYVLRNVGAADTLLQLGRWFGYRPGYADLCRIHLTPEMREHFREISDAVEELREDLVRMKKMGRTPDEFGLKVRQSPTGIAITAANKMRTAAPIRLAADYSSRHIQAYEIFDDNATNDKHLEAVRALVCRLGDQVESDASALVWKGVRVAEIQDFLSRFECPQMDFVSMGDGRSLLSDYIADRASDELALWDVAIPHKRVAFVPGVEKLSLPVKINGAQNLYCRQRLSGVWKMEDPSSKVVKVTQKNAMADLADTDLVYGEDKSALQGRIKGLKMEDPLLTTEQAYLLARERPIMIIHIFQFRLKDGKNAKNLTLDKPVVSVSFGLPGTEHKVREHTYAASVRLIQMLEWQREETETDEDLEDDG